MAYKVIILYRLYMPSYFLGTFTEYPYIMRNLCRKCRRLCHKCVIHKKKELSQ